MRRAIAALAAFNCLMGLAANSAAAGDIELPPGPGRDLVYGKCRTCHDLQYLVDSAGIGRSEWDALLDNMRQYGLRIPAGQRAEILNYLASYLGPNPPAAAAPSAVAADTADGADVFGRQCSACHQAEGQGIPGTFPPLAANADLFIDPLYPVYVVLNGLEGAIRVEGNSYAGVMPPFDHLSDAQVAAVVNYVRKSWGNGRLQPAGFAKIDGAAVKSARAKTMTPQAVLQFRASHQKPAPESGPEGEQ